jgi:hypothetical protein
MAANFKTGALNRSATLPSPIDKYLLAAPDRERHALLSNCCQFVRRHAGTHQPGQKVDQMTVAVQFADVPNAIPLTEPAATSNASSLTVSANTSLPAASMLCVSMM